MGDNAILTVLLMAPLVAMLGTLVIPAQHARARSCAACR